MFLNKNFNLGAWKFMCRSILGTYEYTL